VQTSFKGKANYFHTAFLPELRFKIENLINIEFMQINKAYKIRIFGDENAVKAKSSGAPPRTRWRSPTS